jgi:predicted 3-demethylubiquinone-9 3-methyltransferase (glyoxalase superfamily)
MQKIVPFLWFENQAEEAMNFYTSLFPNSKVLTVSRYGKEGAEVSGRPEGSVMVASVELNGQRFDLNNFGPELISCV